MSALSRGRALLGRRGASSRSVGPSAVTDAVGLTPVSRTTHNWLSLLLSKDCEGDKVEHECALCVQSITSLVGSGRLSLPKLLAQQGTDPRTDSDADLSSTVS